LSRRLKSILTPENVSGDEVSMLRILKRQIRLSVPKASDMTGFEEERAKSALENLRERNFVEFRSNEYWLTEGGTAYLAWSKSVRN